MKKYYRVKERHLPDLEYKFTDILITDREMKNNKEVKYEEFNPFEKKISGFFSTPNIYRLIIEVAAVAVAFYLGKSA
jgi:hypothetical protein